MLSVEHVTKRYGAFAALEDISLTFTPGVYGLLGPNGAGKTTLMKMLATLLFPTKGQILWDGEDILTLGADYRGLLGYLPQQFGYYPNYTPRQFLRYVAALGLTLLWAHLFAVPLCCACSLLVVFLSPARRAVFDWAVVVLLAISVAATCSAIGGDVRLYGVLLALVLFSWASITAYERQYGPLLPTVHGRPKA